jgi:Na+/H+ antiporter NhaD/arsenite permease-like protein
LDLAASWVGITAVILVVLALSVVAANAGGTCSPFGDITTLMVRQAGHTQNPRFLGT